MWTFTISLNAGETPVAEIHSGARQPVRVGTPVEFGGPPEAWCPEGLLAASVGSCLMTSFRYYLQRRSGHAHTYLSAVKATLGKTRQGLRITRIEVANIIGVDGSPNLISAREAAHEAEDNCPVSHSLTCPVEVTWQVNDAPQGNQLTGAPECRSTSANARCAADASSSSPSESANARWQARHAAHAD
jgi:organic hydroperoxide reductase OsmC/OhrA